MRKHGAFAAVGRGSMSTECSRRNLGFFAERTRLLLLATTVLTTQAICPAAAQTAPTAQTASRAISIPAGPLTPALNRLAAQTGLQILFEARLANGKVTRGVQGTMPAHQALSALLAGTGLGLRPAGANAVTIVGPAGAASALSGAIALETIDVQGPTSAATTEGTNSYGSGFATIGKDGASLKETPQSISVVTRKRIEDQNLTTLDQAIATTTGMVVQQGDSDRPNYYARGFPISTVQLDGVPTNVSITTAAQDLAMYDRVEVLRGPAGLLNGIGSPGGTFNLVRKAPLSEFQVINSLSVGSYGYVRNEFDITGPLNASKTVRARLVGTLQSQDFIEDSTYRRLGQIYGVVEAELSDTATARVGTYYQRSPARQAWSGVPAATDYRLVRAPRSTFFGAPWNENIYTQTGAFAEVEHRFDHGWSTKASLNYLRYESDVTSSNFLGQINRTTLTGTFASTRWQQDDQQVGFDWYANGPISLFGREHKLTIGFNASHEDLGQQNFYGPLSDRFYLQTRNIFDLNFPQPAFNGPIFGRHTFTNQYSGYANARIKLADPLTLVAGGRLLWWDSQFKPTASQNFLNQRTTHDRINAEPIPFAGLVYDLNQTYSVYGSYSRIFQPQTTRDGVGDLLKPIEGEQYEAGIKASYLDGRLNASLAVFSLTQQNRALLDPTDPTSTRYFAQGKARAEGIEAEVSGRVTDRWNVFVGYTYTETENLDKSANTNGVAFTTIAPKHLFRLWTSYDLPGVLEKWTVGGGLYASSKFYSEDAGGRLVADGYMTASASIAYKFNETFTASLNVDNIFDRTYIRSLNGVTNGYYGAPRTFTAKLQARW